MAKSTLLPSSGPVCVCVCASIIVLNRAQLVIVGNFMVYVCVVCAWCTRVCVHVCVCVGGGGAVMVRK